MPTPPSLIIWGAGGHAKVVADAARCQGAYAIVGFLDDTAPERWGEAFFGHTIVGGQDRLELLLDDGVSHLIVAIGNNAARVQLAEKAVAIGYKLATVIHPRATVADDVTIGPGTVVVAGAVINPSARLGSNVIINTCASVDHDCEVGDGAHVSPGARLAGGAKIGAGTWLASGAVVAPGVRIGANAVIGAGSVVLENIPDNVLAHGSPARIVRPL